MEWRAASRWDWAGLLPNPTVRDGVGLGPSPMPSWVGLGYLPYPYWLRLIQFHMYIVGTALRVFEKSAEASVILAYRCRECNCNCPELPPCPPFPGAPSQISWASILLFLRLMLLLCTFSYLIGWCQRRSLAAPTGESSLQIVLPRETPTAITDPSPVQSTLASKADAVPTDEDVAEIARSQLARLRRNRSNVRGWRFSVCVV